jgi:hypothetical protein
MSKTAHTPGPNQAVVMTPFGLALIDGPFAEDFTSLKWEFTDHWSGETARFRAAGLDLYVRDYDGDSSSWRMKDIRTGAVLAEGEDWGFNPPNFWKCLADAEAALRAEVRSRVASRRVALAKAEGRS